MKFLFSFLPLFISIVTFSQRETILNAQDLKAIQYYEDTLATFARGVLNADLVEDRLESCHEMIPKLVRALKIPNSFQYKFPRLENVSIQYPSDSTFRIFTWQLKVNEAEYRYFGAIQWNQTELKLVPLVDRSMNMANVYFASHSADNWYGVVYYNIIPFKVSTGETAYLLFGYDAYDVNTRRKIIDVLSFKEGRPVFGLPVFKLEKNNIKYRVIYEYSADAGTRVNYDDKEKMIICDHLQEINGLLPGQGKTRVPDGSYEGFKLENGFWKFQSVVFDSENATNQRAFSTKPKQGSPSKKKTDKSED